MKKSCLLGIVYACLVLIPFTTKAALVNVDWKTPGDNLITRDTISGLEWLDLTETNHVSGDYVRTQLGSGGDFEGFYIASAGEVVSLWVNFGIDLSSGAPTNTPGYDSNVDIAISWLGNTVSELDLTEYPAGVLGGTRTEIIGSPGNRYRRLGAYHHNYIDQHTHYETISDYGLEYIVGTEVLSGTYLARVTTVPLPPALWLFCSGLIGLIGITRKRHRHI